MPELPVVRGCACCGDGGTTPTETEIVTFIGTAIQWGWPQLATLGPVAGRYIAPGWTGVAPGSAGHGNDWYEVKAASMSDLLLRWHVWGDVVRRVSNNGATVQYYSYPDPATPASRARNDRGAMLVYPGQAVGGNPWTLTGEAAYTNSWVAEGFWRQLNTHFDEGDLVYRCIPDALEANDDWHFEPFLCIADIDNPGDPANDPAHFRSLLTGVTDAQIINKLFTPAIGVDLVLAGQCTLYNDGWARALVDFLRSANPTFNSAVAERFNDGRIAHPSVAPPLVDCFPTESRFLSMSHATSFGSLSATSVYTVNEVTGAIDMVFAPMDKFTAPTAPSVGSIVREYVQEWWYSGAQYVPQGWTGGSYTAVPNPVLGQPGRSESDGTQPITQAGEIIKLITRYVAGWNGSGLFPGPLDGTEEETLVTCVVPSTYAEPVQSSENVGFNGGTDRYSTEFAYFEAVAYNARLAYPAVPVPGTDAVRTARLAAFSSEAASAQAQWQTWASSYRLLARRGDNAIIRQTDALEPITLSQDVTMSAENSAASTINRIEFTAHITNGQPRPLPTQPVQVNPDAHATSVASVGQMTTQQGPFFTQQWCNCFFAGPRSGSQRRRACDAITDHCSNLTIPSTGLRITLGIQAWGASESIFQWRRC